MPVVPIRLRPAPAATGKLTLCVTGAYLKVLFRYRDFGPDALPRRSFATWSQTHLSQFPPRRPEQLDGAIAEIRDAYRRNIVLFAEVALRPPRRRR
jgi:hypothetical protein